MQRKTQTLDGESCTNWQLIDSLGIRLEDLSEFNAFGNYSYDFYSNYSIDNIDNYKQFYDNPPRNEGRRWGDWLKKYATVDHGSHKGEKGFILKNGIFERFEPIGITWNDSYCRKITDTGPPGCFVELDLSMTADFDFQENNCLGKDSTI